MQFKYSVRRGSALVAWWSTEREGATVEIREHHLNIHRGKGISERMPRQSSRLLIGRTYVTKWQRGVLRAASEVGSGFANEGARARGNHDSGFTE